MPQRKLSQASPMLETPRHRWAAEERRGGGGLDNHLIPFSIPKVGQGGAPDVEKEASGAVGSQVSYR